MGVKTKVYIPATVCCFDTSFPPHSWVSIRSSLLLAYLMHQNPYPNSSSE